MTNVSVKVKQRKSIMEKKETPLFIQVIAGRRVKRVPLDWRLTPDEWDSRLERVRIPPGTNSERGEYLSMVADELERARAVMRVVIERMGKRNDLAAEDVVRAYNERSGMSSWIDYLDRQAGALVKEGRNTTARHYKSLGRSLEIFLKGRKPPMRGIDSTLVGEYEAYLIAKGLASNTVSFYLRTMRAVWNKAVRDGLIERQTSPFLYVNTRVEHTRKRAVDTAVIEQIKGLARELPPGPAQTLDLFLFCYYARGMAFVDLAYLTRDNIRGNILVYKRRKTGQELRIRLLPTMSRLIERYRSPDSPYLFPVLKPGKDGYGEYQSALRLQNLRLRKIGLRIGQELSTYVPRHSWASAAKKKGVSEELISEGMGHTSVKTTRIYIKAFEAPWLDIMNEYVITGKKRLPRMYMGGLP